MAPEPRATVCQTITSPTMSVRTRASWADAAVQQSLTSRQISVSGSFSATPADQNTDTSNVETASIGLSVHIAGHRDSSCRSLCNSEAENKVRLRLAQRVSVQKLVSASNLPELVLPRQHQTEDAVFVAQGKHSDVWKQKFIVAEDALAYALATIGDLQARIDCLKRQKALDQGHFSKVAFAISGILSTK
jgi:hypothetical protein